jgi:hypothetical protein
MSLFLIVYDRSTGHAEIRQTFPQDRAADAVRARFAVERELSAAPDSRTPARTEVVVLSGDTEDELRRTHARYFASVQELLDVPASVIETRPRAGET